MKILFSIIINALILFLITYLLAGNSNVGPGIVVVGGVKTYLIGGIILGMINVFIRPILKILTIPLFFVFLGLVSFIINGIILWMFDKIVNNILMISGVSYSITGEGLTWWTNFIIAVAIFTILNMFYSLLFNKK